jgi:oligosaccharide repeat unit polymerase
MTRARLGMLVLPVAVGCLVAVIGPPGETDLLVVMTVVALGPFVLAGIRGHFDIFEPVYLFAVSYGVLFVLRPIVELSQAGGPTLVSGQNPVPQYANALLVALLGGLSFYAGYYVSVGRRLASRLAVPHDDIEGANLAVFTVALTVVGIALFFAFLWEAGGLSALTAILAGRNTVTTSLFAESSGYLYTGPFWLAGLGMFLLAVAPRWLSRQGVVGATLLIVSQITTFATGSRSWTLVVASAVVLLWYLRRGRRPSFVLVALLVIPVFVVGISAPRDYRNTSTRDASFAGTAIADLVDLPSSFNAFILGPDTAMLPDLAVEMNYVPSVIPYKLGSTYLGELTLPIPRALWPDKPQAADTQLMEALWPVLAAAHVGFAYSMFGEPYLNFGFVGVLMFGILFGLACRVLYAWFLRDPHNRVAQVLFALSWPFVFVYMRGGVGVDYQRQVILLAPVVVAWLYARKIRRRSPASSLPMAHRGGFGNSWRGRWQRDPWV